MHARHLVAAVAVLALFSILTPACVGTSLPPENDGAVEDDLRDGPVESTKRIVCRGSADDCVRSCHYAGVPCLVRVEHPYKPEAGIGDLFACRTTGNKSCEYTYADGSVCRFFKHPNTVFCT